ncbi:MAG: M23 family metallopeptidase [Bdellovibrionales bacterium]|nr:M23 family metallopeptidase [Bdellovibrionales bacterium]
MSDRFFTFMIVPERSDRIRKMTLPAWLLRAGLFFAAVMTLVSFLLLFDYLHMLSQVAENKKLRVENNLLKMDIQTAKNKVEALDQSVGRLKTFAQKLRVISNLDQPGAPKFLQAPPEGVLHGDAGSEDSGSIGDEAEPAERPQPKLKKGRRKVGPPAQIVNPQSAPAEAPPPPANESPGAAMPSPGADLHSRLEYQRSRTLVSNFGEEFDAQSLEQQIAVISDAAVRLREIAEIEEQNLADLQEHLQDRVFRLLSTPSILPAQGYISSEFGYRTNPFSGTRTFHAGLDIANSIGTVIFAPADGKVTKVGFSGGFGTVIKIDHGYGVATKFGHVSKSLVKDGQRVKRGDKIAEMGNSGRSTGPHVHYQVEVNGRPVQPKLFILDDF